MKKQFKSFIKRLFRREIDFGSDITNFVNVLDSHKKGAKCDELFHGFVKSINFDERIVTISEQIEYIQTEATEHSIPFDSIISLSRMQDGRLRMWIKMED